MGDTESVTPRPPSLSLDIAERLAFLGGFGFGVYLGISTGDVLAGVIYGPLFGAACVGIVYLVRWCLVAARRGVVDSSRRH